MQTVIDIPDHIYNILKDDKSFISNVDHLAIVFKELVKNGAPLPANHGKIVDLGKIDEDKIDKDNPIITININGTAIEAVGLDYLDNLPDLTKKEK